MQAEQEKTVTAVDLDTTIEQVRNLFNLFFQKLNLKFLIVSSSLFAYIVSSLHYIVSSFLFALHRFVLSPRIISFHPFSLHYRLILFIY
jgi:hypothetical protein